MQIDERARKCVAYLIEEEFVDGVAMKHPVGTVFFTGVTVGPKETTIRYAITAGHVVSESKPGTNLYVRINVAGGPPHDVPTEQKDWTFHSTSDVAVCNFGDVLKRSKSGFQNWEDFDARSLPVALFWVGCDSGGPRHDELMVGDEVALIGLCAQHPGHERNQPAVRFGHLSMPCEKILLEISKAHKGCIEAFVVEAQSWGGQSGSPVLVYWPHFREWQANDKGDRGPWLLGLVHGSFMDAEEIDKPKEIPGVWASRANVGLTVVIPATAILESILTEQAAFEIFCAGLATE